MGRLLGALVIALSLAALLPVDPVERPTAAAATLRVAPAPTPALPVRAALVPAFDGTVAMNHVRAIAGPGSRVAGTAREAAAFDYVADRMRAYGYTVKTQTVPLPNGRTTRNVYADLPGRTGWTIVLGGHVDSKSPSPGGNDNASGVGVLLELARALRTSRPVPTVRFAFFGAEESIDADPDHHHYGSRYYVRNMTRAEGSAIAGMVSVDMVGYGSAFTQRSMGRAPRTVVDSLRWQAARGGYTLRYLADPSTIGWSDHEPFEKAGIPVSWIEWRTDPVYHTSADTASHVDSRRVATTGRFLRGWILGLRSSQVYHFRH